MTRAFLLLSSAARRAGAARLRASLRGSRSAAAYAAAWRRPPVHALRAALGLAGIAAAAGPVAAQQPPPPPANPATAAQPAADSTTRIYNIKAGRLHAEVENGEHVVDFDGGVRLESEGTTVESRRARDYHDREHVFFYEDVRVRDRDVTLTGQEGEFDNHAEWAELRGQVRIEDRRGVIRARRARYWRDRGLMWLWGDVDFHDPKSRVQADSVLYREESGLGEAFGHVVITDVESGSVVRGPHGFYDRNTGEARLEPAPSMTLREKGRQDTEMEAQQELHYSRDRSVVRLRGRVRIRRGNTFASADSALLYKKEDRAVLLGNPSVRQEDTRMSGDRIDIYYRANEVERVHVRGQARMVQARADTLLIPDQNVVEGDSAVLYFDKGEISRAVVSGQASSRFVPQEKRPDRISLNEARADSIVMLFENEETDEVLFFGNASGTYRYYEGDLEALEKPRQATLDTTYGVVRGDTTRFDFRKRAEVVNYSAERILYLAPLNDLLLLQAAEVEYQERTLRAGRIHYDADTDLLDATERPVLLDSGDRMYGDAMGYDMDSRKAWIGAGSTEYDQGYYTGRLIRKEAEGELEVTHGNYTTCDLARPHYHFESDQMKIYLHDKVVGRPVRLYLGKVPVGYFPFLINSVNTDRHSGFLQPDVQFGIGDNSRYIRGLDYYWAASPYYDFLFSSEYNERSRPERSTISSVLRDTVDARRVRLQVHGRYKVRYKMDGNVNFNYSRQLGPGTDFYTISGSHFQTLGERTTLRGNLDYSSSELARYQNYQNVDADLARDRRVSSGLTLNRPGNLLSFNTTVNRAQVLSPGPNFTGTVISRTLPQLSLTFRRIRLGPAPKNPRSRHSLRGFLHSLELAPNLLLSRTDNDVRQLARRIDMRTGLEIPPDSTIADSLVIKEYETHSSGLLTASTGASLGRQTNLWIFNVNPSVSYTERYVRTTPTVVGEKRHFRTIGTNMSAATKFYGFFYPHVFGITAVRHILDPSAGITYVPEIRGQQRRFTSVSLSMHNQIDVKYKRKDAEKRLDGLFDWSLSTTYNPTVLGGPGQPDRKFGIISSSITLNRSGPLRLTIGQSYDPYRGRILSTSMGPWTLHLAGKFGYGDTGLQEEERNRVVQEEGKAGSDSAAADSLAGMPKPRQQELLQDVESVKVGSGGAGGQAWDLQLSYSFNREFRQELGRSEVRSARVGVGFGIQPTRNWHIAYRGSFDATVGRLGNPEIRITRDLHCWKASFSRILLGGEWHYYVRVYVDRHQEDLFLESGERGFKY